MVSFLPRTRWDKTNNRGIVLAEEVSTGMRLLGVTSLDQLRPEMVNASQLLNEMWRPESFWTKSRL